MENFTDTKVLPSVLVRKINKSIKSTEKELTQMIVGRTKENGTYGYSSL